MEALEIYKAIKAVGFTTKNISITDGDYARPTTKYLVETFFDFYIAWLKDHNLSQWKNTWDCDNFSSTYYVFAQMCHVKSGRPEEGLAVGELFYKRGDGGGHAINVAFTEKGLILIEPQTGKEVELTEFEKADTVMIRF